jgi:hypothetical protein
MLHHPDTDWCVFTLLLERASAGLSIDGNHLCRYTRRGRRPCHKALLEPLGIKRGKT